VAENQTGSRAEEVARVRGYLTGQAAKLTPEQIVEKVRVSQTAVLNAASAVPAERFSTPPADGEWSATEVLYHVLTVIGDNSRSIISTIRTGTPSRVRPDRLEHLTNEVTLDDVRDLMSAEREELFSAVQSADPNAHLDVVVASHPEFGEFNWREALLFMRVHDLDHARQLDKIAAVGSTA
jgi:uncharacterized damage-inducible protein DinB